MVVRQRNLSKITTMEGFTFLQGDIECRHNLQLDPAGQSIDSDMFCNAKLFLNGHDAKFNLTLHYNSGTKSVTKKRRPQGKWRCMALPRRVHNYYVLTQCNNLVTYYSDLNDGFVVHKFQQGLILLSREKCWLSW